MSKKNQRGFVFTLESTIAILVFSLLLLTISFPASNSMTELLVIQQANDLLKVWSVTYPSNNEIVFDTRELFGSKASVSVDRIKILNNTCFGDAVSSEAILLDDFLIEREFVINVCLD
ncbi:MAG: hypothetical protein HOE11_00040 [Candidatus Diapherotrites archaeon]|jgi:hypothetical protein|nr:hypothetical protein [Candidatus Diapherotrites archaeon]MBT4597193.1 hypothetical protein [Candidatus Diapherotrites archaeon]